VGGRCVLNGSECRGAVADHVYTVHRHCVPRGLDQPPGGASLGVGRWVGARRETDGVVVRRRRVLAELGDGGDDLGELIWVFEVGREAAVVAGGPAQRLDVAGESGGPHRHSGLLNWSGQELDALDGVVAAAVVHRRTGPGDGEDLQCLVEHLASQPVIELLVGLGQLAAEAVAAEADAEGEAATAEPVQGRGFPGDLGWSVIEPPRWRRLRNEILPGIARWR
jgi:hypothetical protein